VHLHAIKAFVLLVVKIGQTTQMELITDLNIWIATITTLTEKITKINRKRCFRNITIITIGSYNVKKRIPMLKKDLKKQNKSEIKFFIWSRFLFKKQSSCLKHIRYLWKQIKLFSGHIVSDIILKMIRNFQENYLNLDKANLIWIAKSLL